MATKECHENVCKGRKTFIKGVEGTFTTESVAEKHDHEINRVIPAETGAGKLYVVLDSFEQADMGQDLRKSCHFSHPGWG